MIRIATLSATVLLTISGTAFAQTAPAAPAASAADPGFAHGATFALNAAYRAIGDAETGGGSPYLDSAKNHYRNALARFARQDPGAASEALAAVALAHAALAEHPAPGPRDLAAPPAIDTTGMPGMGGAPGMGGGPGMAGAPMHGATMHGFGPMGGLGPHGGQFDAARLADDVKLANTQETKDYAQRAIDADIAHTRAAFSGNLAEAMKQGRLAGALAMAVGALAHADHPSAMPIRHGVPRRPTGATTSSI